MNSRFICISIGLLLISLLTVGGCPKKYYYDTDYEGVKRVEVREEDSSGRSVLKEEYHVKFHPMLKEFYRAEPAGGSWEWTEESQKEIKEDMDKLMASGGTGG